MENWIIMICLIYDKLEEFVDRYDDRIMKLALRPSGNCTFDYARITESMNCKNMLINLKILYEHIREVISEQDVEAIKYVVTRERIRKYCEKNGVKPITMLRRVRKAFFKAKEVLLKLSYNQTKFKKDYANVLEVSTLFEKISKANWERRVSSMQPMDSKEVVTFASIIQGKNGYLSAFPF